MFELKGLTRFFYYLVGFLNFIIFQLHVLSLNVWLQITDLLRSTITLIYS